jgi:hypothetical protein
LKRRTCNKSPDLTNNNSHFKECRERAHKFVLIDVLHRDRRHLKKGKAMRISENNTSEECGACQTDGTSHVLCPIAAGAAPTALNNVPIETRHRKSVIGTKV